jgi:hypothetical protein
MQGYVLHCLCRRHCWKENWEEKGPKTGWMRLPEPYLRLEERGYMSMVEVRELFIKADLVDSVQYDDAV